MACSKCSDKPLSEPMVNQDTDLSIPSTVVNTMTVKGVATSVTKSPTATVNLVFPEYSFLGTKISRSV